jgi:hypothetical protein
VGLSSKDRKLLWGPARNIGAFPQCRQSFTQDQVDRQDPRILPYNRWRRSAHLLAS